MTKKTVHTFSTTHQKLLSIIISEETRITQKTILHCLLIHFRGIFILKTSKFLTNSFLRKCLLMLKLESTKVMTNSFSRIFWFILNFESYEIFDRFIFAEFSFYLKFVRRNSWQLFWRIFYCILKFNIKILDQIVFTEFSLHLQMRR